MDIELNAVYYHISRQALEKYINPLYNSYIEIDYFIDLEGTEEKFDIKLRFIDILIAQRQLDTYGFPLVVQSLLNLRDINPEIYPQIIEIISEADDGMLYKIINSVDIFKVPNDSDIFRTSSSENIDKAHIKYDFFENYISNSFFVPFD